jgi:hypothetical protein
MFAAEDTIRKEDMRSGDGEILGQKSDVKPMFSFSCHNRSWIKDLPLGRNAIF